MHSTIQKAFKFKLGATIMCLSFLSACCSDDAPPPVKPDTAQKTTAVIPPESKENIRQILLEEPELDPQPTPEYLALLRKRIAERAATKTIAAIPPESKENIRQILLEELKLDPQPTPEYLALLRKRIATETIDGRQRLYSAIELTVYGDASGADILLRPRDYYVSSSGYEITYAFAALVLIDRVPENSLVSHTSNWSLRLQSALMPYIAASHTSEVRSSNLADLWKKDVKMWPPPPFRQAP
jgi:hypothetical protein